MPVDIVDMQVTVDAAAIPRPTYTDPLLIGTAVDEPPGADFEEVRRYTDAGDVADDYGDGSDVYASSQDLQSMGTDEWRVIVLEEHHVEDETVADGEEIENAPILGTADVEAEGDVSIEWTTGLPSAEDPGSGEAVINADTGEVATGDADVTLDYAYVEWSALDDVTDDVDIVAKADTTFGIQGIGDLSAIVTWADGDSNGVVANHIDGRTEDTDEDAMEVCHDVASYAPSNNLFMIAHKSSEDVAAHVLGELATNRPWHNLYWEEIPVATEYYPKRLVGDPATPGTFEGGVDDPDAGGEGATNVLINVVGTTILSNSQSTAGAGSDYQYFDIGRTEAYMVAELERALMSLRLRETRIPFMPVGRTMIKQQLVETLDPVTGGINDPLAEYDLDVPEWDEIPTDDRANRVWPDIHIEGRLAGDTHTFGVDLTLTV